MTFRSFTRGAAGALLVGSVVLVVAGRGRGWLSGGGGGSPQAGQRQPKKPLLKELPGHFTEGELQIHPYDRYLPALYGPYEAGQSNSMQMRVLNKAWEAVDHANLAFSIKSPGGEAAAAKCQSQFEKEGVYRVTCMFDKAGDWEMVIVAESSGKTGKMGYKFKVVDASMSQKAAGQ